MGKVDFGISPPKIKFGVTYVRYNPLMSDPRQVELLRLLVARLERLSADSHWARRASGTRGNLLKVLEEIDSGQVVVSERLDRLVEAAFDLLRRAAQEIPDLEALRRKF